MRIRITTIAVMAALAVTLVGCSSGDDGGGVSTKPTKAGTPKATKAANEDNSDAEKAAAIPPEPTGVERLALLTALKVVNPVLVVDEDKAVDNARNQCSTINGGGNADQSAKARFSTSDHEVSDAEAKAINEALTAMFCTS
ncbi:hypothetical protein [Streptomyces sp. NPDC048643]|uniref:hypothetical protein n=1 Tax=Streptomyces sp. NPDC048643 TaxID=3155637 RepID=UPI00344868E1